jgi:Na+-transporting methylmalonyl-CoA/oxaloacetate decarboxylase gamma subunit
MLDLLQDALKSPAGSFAFVFAMLAICFFAVWKISHFTTKFGTVEKLETSIGHIKEDMHYVKASIKIITDSTNPLAQRHSPVSLTKKGLEVSDELKIDDLIINHWEDIFSKLNKVLSNECNPYDIQVESFKIGETYQEFLNLDELKKVKTHAFKSGFTLEVYNLLFGIIIRDKYLKVKGFKLEDVDLFDPIKKAT